jgi:hypothetical protein
MHGPCYASFGVIGSHVFTFRKPLPYSNQESEAITTSYNLITHSLLPLSYHPYPLLSKSSSCIPTIITSTHTPSH